MSELRRDPITGRWVVLTPEYTRRPYDFTPPAITLPDAQSCPFCEGREAIAGRELLAWRASGSYGGPGWLVRVVPNREPILRVEANFKPLPEGRISAAPDPGRNGVVPPAPLQAYEGLGAHEVVIESPRHDATLATMAVEEVGRVLWAWRERIRDLKRDIRLTHFLVIKNHGALAGALQSHSHSQIIAMPLAPPELEVELAGAARYRKQTRACVFCDVLQYEIESDRRVLAADEEVVTFAPFAARVPFEMWIVPRRHAPAFEDATDALLLAVAGHLHRALRRLDKALLSPPFNLVLHTAPVAKRPPTFHWHLEIVPRLWRVSGLEWGGGLHVNPVPPEEAAQVLRGL